MTCSNMKYSNLEEYSDLLARNAQKASKTLRTLPGEKRSAVLNRVAQILRDRKPEILAANKIDLEAAAGKLDDSKMDRLTLNDARIEAMAKGAEEIASFADPLNKVLESRELKNGIKISRIAVPIGSVFFIFESRPNVTIDGACLCFKAGNAVILRGGKESLNSAKCLAGIFHEALAEEGIDQDAVQLVTETSHDLVGMLLQRNDCLDLVIPRGGERLIRAVVEQSKIPVIKHFNGICHVYVDKSADMDKAVNILINAKTQRTGVCNAMECVIIDRHIDAANVKKLLDCLDLVIPRGGERLIRAVVEQSKIPVIKHFNGICHVYVDKSADMDKAVNILINAKTQRTGVCNAMECVIIDRHIDAATTKKLLDCLADRGVELFGNKDAQSHDSRIKDIGDDSNYHHEYLALKTSVKFVDNVAEACDHIEKNSSRHTEAVVAEDASVQDYFVANVDSSSVMVNASTRFADGGEYGLGAEVGISTDKLHARGPMGVESLCSYKWILRGNGQVRG